MPSTNRLSLVLVALLAPLLASGCDKEPDVLDRCPFEAATDYSARFADDASAFTPGAQGHGTFGRWLIGPYGLPEYAYTLRQESDPSATWENTENRERRDHWHLVGNHRINALAYNDGYVELFVQERGNENLLRFDAASKNFGGGFSIIESGGDVWSSAYKYRPTQSRTSRSFGMGYVRYQTCDGNLSITRTISAPAGDAAYLIDDVEILNLTGEDHAFRHYEVWDVNRHYIAQQEVRSGTLNPKLPASLDEERSKLNKSLELSSSKHENIAALHHTPTRVEFSVSADAAVNWYPPTVYLESLSETAVSFITDGSAFWGENGSPASPALSDGDLQPTGAYGQPGVLIGRTAHTLKRGEKTKLRFRLGYVANGAPLPGPATAPSLPQMAKTRSAELLRLNVPQAALPADEIDAASLRREMAWHSYYLQNLGGYQDYFEHFVVNQGSAYWYLHGLDGAVRDFVFSAAVLAYVNPHLARETLLYAARMRFEQSRALAYTVGNHGQISSAVIHTNPSDLDLFWWWGLAEYVAATGDTSILMEAEPFWPKDESSPRPIADHLEASARYLLDEIGTGPNGLVRLGSGDWDDSITFFAESRQEAETVGESVANAAMAAFIAPWASALMSDYPATATEVENFGTDQATQMLEEWTGEWYRRAWFGPDKPFGDDAVFLFSNALAMIAGIPSQSQADTLVDNLHEYLEKDSTTAAFQFYYLNPPAVTMDGVTDPGASNPIISGLHVWGLVDYAPERAWQAFLRNTMARKAEIYPDIWYGIWSGPDAHYTSIHEKAGQTWASVATPQKDFPIMNSNQHNGPLLGALRLFGLEPAMRKVGERRLLALKIAPRLPHGHAYSIDTALIQLTVSDGLIEGKYRPIQDGPINLLFTSPPGTEVITSLHINGEPIEAGKAEILTQISGKEGAPLSFKVVGGPAQF